MFSMPKKSYDGSAMVSETGNWNVADDYSKSKIMKPLILADYYEDVATFGYDSIIDELIDYARPPNDYIRISAMRRYIKILIRVIDNSKFALKKGNSKKMALEYKSKLKKLSDLFELCFEVKYDSSTRTKTLKITDDAKFELVLQNLSDIKSKINEPLNQNHLIFVDKEEFDPKAFKKSLKERMINKG